MKKSDLHREWARVLDMCDWTDVSPKNCWKFKGSILSEKPEFDSHPNDYEFAIAILEGKPVFVGDKIWSKILETYMHLREARSYNDINDRSCSWHEPSKTFVLNGVELPLPNSNSNGVRLDFLGVDYFFETVEDRNKVAKAINDLLEGESN